MPKKLSWKLGIVQTESDLTQNKSKIAGTVLSGRMLPCSPYKNPQSRSLHFTESHTQNFGSSLKSRSSIHPQFASFVIECKPLRQSIRSTSFKRSARFAIRRKFSVNTRDAVYLKKIQLRLRIVVVFRSDRGHQGFINCNTTIRIEAKHFHMMPYKSRREKIYEISSMQLQMTPDRRQPLPGVTATLSSAVESQVQDLKSMTGSTAKLCLQKLNYCMDAHVEAAL